MNHLKKIEDRVISILKTNVDARSDDMMLYNLQSYDVAVIISDAKGAYARGLFELSMILKEFGCQEILCLAGTDDV